LTPAPAHLPAAQQIGLLILRKSELADACASRLRAEGAPHPSEADYLALSRTGFAMRSPAGTRMLTPLGKSRTDAFAIAIARQFRLHVITHGSTPGVWFVRCSCGEFFTSKPHAIPGALAKAAAAGARHLRLVCDRTEHAPIGAASTPAILIAEETRTAP
jgi:hypothetical protein